MLISNHVKPRFFGNLFTCGIGVFLAILAQLVSIQAQTTLNVTNYGARGDAVQFWVNTTSNSVVVTTTNQLSSVDIGKAIEVFGAGPATGPTNNQDLIATITQVSDATNITMSLPAGASCTNTFAAYGHNNQSFFQAAIAACSGATNAIINIPAGTYLFLTSAHSAVYGYSGIVLNGGGIHFVGAGTNSTTLLSQGAWTMHSGAAWRGFLIEVVSPIANDFPVSLENLTMDGGVQQGNTSNHSFPASTNNGAGWDETHDAVLLWGPVSGGHEISHWTWTNVVFQHWRGEMVKSIDQSTNGNLNIFNCVFSDGNATAINIYPSLNISNCVFENLFQVAEYYQAYSTNICYFQSNLVTNITGNGFALNGGKGINPPFIIQGNTIYWTSSGNAIETVPADNVFISSNQFLCGGYGAAIVLGAAGYQGTYCNSNIVIAYNNFVTPDIMIEIAGGTSATDPARVESVQVYSNTLTGTFRSGWSAALTTYDWATNIHFFNNDFSSHSTAKVDFASGKYGGGIALVETNNLYYGTASQASATNKIDYANGCRFAAQAPSANMVYYLQDSDALQIPIGAQIIISNSAAFSYPFQLYLNTAMTVGPLNMPPGGPPLVFQWTNGAWQLAVVPPSPPTDLHIVSP